MNRNCHTALFLALSAGLCFGAAHAQTATSPKIIIANAPTPTEIPLEADSTVQFLSNGDLSVNCRLNGGICPSTGGGSSGNNPPTATLSPSSTTLSQGAAFTLNWNTANSAEACYAVGPANIANWTGRTLNVNGNQSLSLLQGEYVFQMRCYSDGGKVSVSTPLVTVEPGSTPPPVGSDYCAEVYGSNPPTVPNFTAFGFERVDRDYASVWGVQPGMGQGDPRVVPGEFMNPTAQRYLAISFVMANDVPGTSESQYRIDWREPQAQGVPGGMVSVAISPCPGDFRAPVTFSSDLYESAACRKTVSSLNTLSVTSVQGAPGCYAPKGKTMYINVATHNMYGTTAPTTSTCGNNTACGASMEVR